MLSSIARGQHIKAYEVRVENVAVPNAPCQNRAMHLLSLSQSSLPRRFCLAIALLLTSVVTTGCNDLHGFSTEDGEAYCGAITLGSAFRAGLSPRVQMRLELDAEALEGPDSPGTLSTYEAPTSILSERRLFENASLIPIPPLAHDPLSRLEMGEGRERNAIYAVSPSDPTASGVLAFLSLRTDRGIEVRLLRPGTNNAEDDARKLIFGLFSLVKREGSCGF